MLAQSATLAKRRVDRSRRPGRQPASLPLGERRRRQARLAASSSLSHGGASRADGYGTDQLVVRHRQGGGSISTHLPSKLRCGREGVATASASAAARRRLCLSLQLLELPLAASVEEVKPASGLSACTLLASPARTSGRTLRAVVGNDLARGIDERKRALSTSVARQAGLVRSSSLVKTLQRCCLFMQGTPPCTNGRKVRS